MLKLADVTTTGSGLNRPECVLATEKGDLYTGDWRGGIAHVKADGRHVLYQGQTSDIPEGLRPNGIALEADGSFLFANLGTETGGVSTQVGTSTSTGRGGGEGGSKSESHRKQVLQKTRAEIHETGRKRHGYADQMEKFKSDIFDLGTAECAVKLRSRKKGFLMKVAHVSDVWAAENKFSAIEKLRVLLYALRTYYFPPTFGPAAQRERLDAFVKPVAALAPKTMAQLPAELPPAGENPPADETRPVENKFGN